MVTVYGYPWIKNPTLNIYLYIYIYICIQIQKKMFIIEFPFLNKDGGSDTSKEVNTHAVYYSILLANY